MFTNNEQNEYSKHFVKQLKILKSFILVKSQELQRTQVVMRNQSVDVDKKCESLYTELDKLVESLSFLEKNIRTF